jgi:hypothetical protein
MFHSATSQINQPFDKVWVVEERQTVQTAGTAPALFGVYRGNGLLRHRQTEFRQVIGALGGNRCGLLLTGIVPASEAARFIRESRQILQSARAGDPKYPDSELR